MTTLESINVLLGVSDGLDKKLDVIVELTQKRLKARLGVSTVPDELEYIVIEVSIKRYNRIGSEGVSSHSVEGESMSFSDDDFNEFSEDIATWLSNQKEAKKGRVRFL